MSLISTSVSFFCQSCRLDQDLPAFKGEYGDDEYFWARCRECDKKLVRYISERERDPYYHLSLKLKKERDKLRIDLLQPNDNRFQLWYRDQWRKIEEDGRKYEASLKKEKESRDDFYKKYRHNVTERNAARAVIEAEEKLQYGAN